MGYYAKIKNGIVEQVVVADVDVIAAYDGEWVETFAGIPAHTYAGIGDGCDGVSFFKKPFPKSAWDNDIQKWITPDEMGILDGASPIIPADGVDFVTIYLISSSDVEEIVTLNDEPLTVKLVDGYGEFDLSSDTAGLISVCWKNFKLEVAVI
jgi:hypothetical protein